MNIIKSNNKEYFAEISLYDCVGDGDDLMNSVINTNLKVDNFRWMKTENIDGTNEWVGLRLRDDGNYDFINKKNYYPKVLIIDKTN